MDSKGAGKFVDIPAYTDMSAHFGEPCSGVNKFLNISYKVDGKIGDVSFAEAHDHLIVPVIIKAPMVSPGMIFVHIYNLTVHDCIMYSSYGNNCHIVP